MGGNYGVMAPGKIWRTRTIKRQNVDVQTAGFGLSFAAQLHVLDVEMS